MRTIRDKDTAGARAQALIRVGAGDHHDPEWMSANVTRQEALRWLALALQPRQPLTPWELEFCKSLLAQRQEDSAGLKTFSGRQLVVLHAIANKCLTNDSSALARLDIFED